MTKDQMERLDHHLRMGVLGSDRRLGQFIVNRVGDLDKLFYISDEDLLVLLAPRYDSNGRKIPG